MIHEMDSHLDVENSTRTRMATNIYMYMYVLSRERFILRT